MKENLDLFDWSIPEDLLAKISEIEQASPSIHTKRIYGHASGEQPVRSEKSLSKQRPDEDPNFGWNLQGPDMLIPPISKSPICDELVMGFNRKQMIGGPSPSKRVFSAARLKSPQITQLEVQTPRKERSSRQNSSLPSQVKLVRGEWFIHPQSIYKSVQELWDGEI
ncbi:hypothetical protein ACMD2_06150 [Ananas comosus]|uniref:Uncharacterized protein n=1 Tax=Ananas comosus TaxID=4615 RepID=A0A199VJ78_ANACO|nr:hypothetical protein ACMD2_06150 [Ananas comosus]